MDVKERLKQAEMFAGVSDRMIDRIAAIATLESFDEGDKVYELGDDATDMYIVETGRIRAVFGVGNRDGGSISMPGMAFGWAALLEASPRRVATTACLEDSTLYRVPAAPLLELFAEEPHLGYKIMRKLATIIARDFMSVINV